MKITAEKVLKTGFGLGLLTLVQAKKVVVKVKKELNLSEKESLALARRLVTDSRKACDDVIGTVSKHFEGAVLKSGLAKKKDLLVVKNVLKRKVKKVLKIKKVVEKRVKKAVKKRK